MTKDGIVDGGTGEMNEDRFWEVLGRLDFDEEDDDILEPAVAALAAMRPEDIESFERMMASKLHALDTRAHAAAVYAGEHDPDDGDDYISADDFLYARCAMLVNGREAYEAALGDPGRMLPEVTFEPILYLADRAYERATGNELPSVDGPSYESFRNQAGWAPTSATKPGWATSEGVPTGNRRPG